MAYEGPAKIEIEKLDGFAFPQRRVHLLDF